MASALDNHPDRDPRDRAEDARAHACRDAYEALRQVGVVPKPTAALIEAPLTTPEGKRRSQVLHRLRVLGIPEFELTRGPSMKRGATDLSEKWQFAKRIETDAAGEVVVLPNNISTPMSVKRYERLAMSRAGRYFRDLVSGH